MKVRVRFNEAGWWYYEALTEQEWLNASRLLERFETTRTPKLELWTHPNEFVLRDEHTEILLLWHEPDGAFYVTRVDAVYD